MKIPSHLSIVTLICLTNSSTPACFRARTSVRCRYRVWQILMRQTWVDAETKLNLVKKVAAMIDHIGAPAHLKYFEPTEFPTALASNYFDNSLRVSRADSEVKYSEILRPGLRHREHWPLDIAPVRSSVRPLSFLATIHVLISLLREKAVGLTTCEY